MPPSRVSESGITALIWLARLWPPTLAVLALARYWPRSRHRVALFVLGTLLGFGVQWIIGAFVTRLPVSARPSEDYSELVTRAFVLAGWRNQVLSILCSVPLVVWLHYIARDTRFDRPHS